MIDSSKYVVLDVETNGLSSENDDLLSISIYKPDDQKIFNKFLPLEKAKKVFTTEFNGITLETLNDACPLTQLELDKLIEDFDIKNRVVLTFGDLDKRFFKNYLKRKKLKGFNEFYFYNFKEDIFSSSFQGGNVTKDNLCKLYGIDNVQKIHSGINDCILEWKLFEKMDTNKLIVLNDNVYEYNEDYIVPVSYVTYYKRLKKQLTLPNVAASLIPMFEQSLDKKTLFRFGSNISGISIENVINSILNVTLVDSSQEIAKNISKLKYIGTLPKAYNEILVTKNDDGTLNAVNNYQSKMVELINEISILIKGQIYDFVHRIETEIFKSEEIFSQELVINKDYNLLSLCDLSNKHAVVEIKTSCEMNINDFALQLYVQSNARPVYLLYMDWLKKAIKLGKIEFYFNDEADKIAADNKAKILIRERDDLQKSYFDKKELDLVIYKGKTCVSEFKCRKCNKTFKMKNHLTFDHCYYLKCPYCNPSSAPRYDKIKDNRDTGAKKLYWKSLSLKNIEITNWVLKEEIYAKCKECNYEWCDDINNILTDVCPNCKHGKINGIS